LSVYLIDGALHASEGASLCGTDTVTQFIGHHETAEKIVTMIDRGDATTRERSMPPYQSITNPCQRSWCGKIGTVLYVEVTRKAVHTFAASQPPEILAGLLGVGRYIMYDHSQLVLSHAPQHGIGWRELLGQSWGGNVDVLVIGDLGSLVIPADNDKSIGWIEIDVGAIPCANSVANENIAPWAT
jgi:hypothetical protein